MGNDDPAAAEAHVPATREHAPRSLGSRSLRRMAWGVGLAVIACIGGYLGGFVGTVVFAFLPALAVALGAALVLVTILIRASVGHPRARQAAPVFLGMVTFSAAALFGSLFVVPRVYERHVETLKGAAVEAVESHRSRTGHYPASDDALAGLPDEVRYGRPVDANDHEDESTYTLYIENRFTWFAGWWYESDSRDWTYINYD